MNSCFFPKEKVQKYLKKVCNFYKKNMNLNENKGKNCPFKGKTAHLLRHIHQNSYSFSQ
tara:strand:- start:16316 stop:16492 length:177 start_codon:yes stop_codon:yes gene_type:complete